MPAMPKSTPKVMPSRKLALNVAPPAAKPNAAPPPAKAPFNATQAKAHQAAWAKHLGTEIETTNSVGAKLILVPPGSFLMGSTDAQVVAALKAAEEVQADVNTKSRIEKSERPQHLVVFSKPLLMGATEVTIGQFKKFSATGFLTEAEKAARLKPQPQPKQRTPLR